MSTPAVTNGLSSYGNFCKISESKAWLRALNGQAGPVSLAILHKGRSKLAEIIFKNLKKILTRSASASKFNF